MFDIKAALRAPSELRAEPRFPLKRHARLAIENGAVIEARTIDISASGLGVIVERSLPVGQKCSVRFEVYYMNQIRQMSLHGMVAFCALKGTEGFRIGIRANELDPDLAQYVRSLLQ